MLAGITRPTEYAPSAAGSQHRSGGILEQRHAWRRRLYGFALWALTVVIALGIGAAGLAKLVQSQHWRALFIGWGYPSWFSPIVGAAEVAGAIGLLVPRLALYAASFLGFIMLSALITLATHPGGPLGWGGTPASYLVLLALIWVARWQRRRSIDRIDPVTAPRQD